MVYYHMPAKDYTVEVPDSELMISLKLDDLWNYNFKEKCVYQRFRLTKGPGCQHRVCSCEV